MYWPAYWHSAVALNLPRTLPSSAWTYYARGSKPQDDSAVTAGLGTQADQSAEALSTLLSLISPLSIENTRYDVARTSVEASFRKTRISPRARASRVLAWQALGQMQDLRPAQFEALDATKANAVESFANACTKVTPIISVSAIAREFT